MREHLHASAAMHAQLIEKALEKYGSVTGVAANFEIHRANLSRYFSAKKLPAYIAHMLAVDLGENEVAAIIEAEKYAARSEREKRYWSEMLLKALGIE